MRLTIPRRLPVAVFVLVAALFQIAPHAAHAGDPTGHADDAVDYGTYQDSVDELLDVADKQRDLINAKKTLREQQRKADELAAAAAEADPALRAAFAGQLLDLQAEIDSIEHEIALGDLDLRLALAEQAHRATLVTLDACEDDPVDPKP